jgi:hypothetical protein
MEAGRAVSRMLTNYDSIARRPCEWEIAEGARTLPLHVRTLRASASCLLLGVAFGMFIELSFALPRTELILTAVLV